MKKLINRPEDLVAEMLEGIAACYPGLARLEGWPVIVASDRQPDAPLVALISGGGSGHEPAHAGYVGAGMLTAAVAGAVFTSPSSDAVLAAIRAVGGPAGVLLIVKNYTGDRLNFGIAAEQARLDGIPVEMVIVADDVALAQSVENAGRRGISGTVLVHKLAGAAAQAGLPLSLVAAEARQAAAAVRSMGVALSACNVPGAEAASFDLGENEVELGLGIHGEPGVKRVPLSTCDQLVRQLLEPIATDLALKPGDRCALLVNNLGGTPHMELMLAAREALAELERRAIVVERVYTGAFLTAIEMAGVSLSVMRVDDQALVRLDAATKAPAWPTAQSGPRSDPDSRIRQLPRPASAMDEKAGVLARPTTPTGVRLAQALTLIIDVLRSSEAQLNALDRAVGDGDLGQNLSRGSDAILQAWNRLPFDQPVALLRQVAQIVQKEVGGTSGPLHAVFLLRMALSLSVAKGLDPEAWLAAARAGAAGISELGGAKRGDRTMLDSLEPALDALEQGLSEGLTDSRIWETAARAANEGAAATAQLLPRRGRSSYLGVRALGHPDPGASEASLIFQALATTPLKT